MSRFIAPPPINEGTAAPPRLRLDLNFMTLVGLPEWSTAPTGEPEAVFAGVKAAGYEGWQSMTRPPEAAVAAGLKPTSMARVLDPAGLDAVAAEHKAWGVAATTLHLGQGMETDAELDAFAAATLEASARHGHPLYIELHRATMTQDARRTVDLTARFPELRFNADLQHWYLAGELTYGEMGPRLDAMQPVFERVVYMHGRIGSSGASQSPVHGADGAEAPYVAHYRDMWTRCARGFRSLAGPGDVLVFAPELLPASVEFGGRRLDINYAPLDAQGQELTDRWTEALKLCAIMTECFEAAVRALG